MIEFEQMAAALTRRSRLAFLEMGEMGVETAIDERADLATTVNHLHDADMPPVDHATPCLAQYAYRSSPPSGIEDVSSQR